VHGNTNGKDGVAGSIPAGGPTQALTSGNAGQVNSWASSAGLVAEAMCSLEPMIDADAIAV
jgi:hypothetical protein